MGRGDPLCVRGPLPHPAGAPPKVNPVHSFSEFLLEKSLIPTPAHVCLCYFYLPRKDRPSTLFVLLVRSHGGIIAGVMPNHLLPALISSLAPRPTYSTVRLASPLGGPPRTSHVLWAYHLLPQMGSPSYFSWPRPRQSPQWLSLSRKPATWESAPEILTSPVGCV